MLVKKIKKSIYSFFIIFIALFGIKFSIIDLRLIFFPLLYFYTDGNFIILKKLQTDTLLLFIILTYSFILFVITLSDLDFMRYLRALISMLFIPIYVKYYIKFFSKISLVKIMIVVISVHLTVMYLMFFFPSIQPYIWQLYGYNKELKTTRVSGLTAGFDIAGYFLLCGIILSVNLFLIRLKYIYVLIALLFSTGVLISSRTNIILLLLIWLFYGIKIIQKQKKNKLISLIFIFFSFSFLFLKYYSLIAISFGYEILNDSMNRNDVIEKGYSINDPMDVLSSFLVLPDTLLGLIFGINKVPQSDSGYIQLLNTIGIVGLIFSCWFYFGILKKIINKEIKKYNESNIVNATIQIILLTIIVTIKNQYMFARGSFELIIILYSLIVLKSTTQIKCQK